MEFLYISSARGHRVVFGAFSHKITLIGLARAIVDSNKRFLHMSTGMPRGVVSSFRRSCAAHDLGILMPSAALLK